jgi:hypothetical protein
MIHHLMYEYLQLKSTMLTAIAIKKAAHRGCDARPVHRPRAAEGQSR